MQQHKVELLRDDIRAANKYGPVYVRSASSQGQPACSGRTLGKDLKALSDCNSAARFTAASCQSSYQCKPCSNHIVPNSASLSPPATSPVGPDPLPASCKQEELVRSRVCSFWLALDLIFRSMSLMNTVGRVVHRTESPQEQRAAFSVRVGAGHNRCFESVR